MMKTEGRTWYLTTIAAVYLALCTAACAYYVSLHFRANAGTVPLFTQLLCLGMAISAALYFFNARLGHKALLALTALSVLAIGTSNAKATAFHIVVLLVLLVPFLTGRKRQREAANHTPEPILANRAEGSM